MIKLLLPCRAAVLLLLLLAACGQPSVPAATAPSSAATDDAAPSAAAVADGSTAASASGDKAPIRIGVYAPMTGPIAFLGEGFQLGAQLAVEDLGGAIEGHPLELVVADNKCNPTDSVNAVRKLIDVDEVHVLLGGGCSSATLAALPIIEEGATPAVSATSSNPQIYEQMGAGGNIWQFRINPDDMIMAAAFSKYVGERAKSLSLVAENSDFGRGAIAAFKPYLEQQGLEIMSEDFFDSGTADYRPALTRIKSTNPEALLIVMTERDGATFMRQLREVGLSQKLFSRGSLTSPLFLEYTKDNPSIGNGVLEFSFWSAGLDPKQDQHFQERYGKPNSPHRAMSYYAVYHVIAEAIRNAARSGDVTRESIRAELEKVNVETPVGTITFDDHHQAYPKGTVATIEDGAITFVEAVELVPVEH